MIAVIDYDRSVSQGFEQRLESLGTKYKITCSEHDISAADKLILPDGADAQKAIRKLQLLNLLHLLKILHKPVLGIGLGLLMMHNKLNPYNINGIGYFPWEAELDKIAQFAKPEYLECTIKYLRNSMLFAKVPIDHKFTFSGKYMLPVNDFTTSQIEIRGAIVSASLEKDNYYGILFDIEHSGDTGIQILRNFIEKC